MRIIATLAQPDLGRGLCLRQFDLHQTQGNPPPGRLHARLLRRLRRHEGDRVPGVFCGRLSHQRPGTPQAYATRMLEIVDLDFKRDAFANTLSRGQTQRLGLARVAAARSAGPAAGRTPQRPRSAGPDRNAQSAAHAWAKWARRSSSPATSCPNWPTSATRSASSTAA